MQDIISNYFEDKNPHFFIKKLKKCGLKSVLNIYIVSIIWCLFMK
jgi:hypothetical protein